MSLLRLALEFALALLPSVLKIPLYRWLLGYQIGSGVRIGLSPILRVGRCCIGDHVRIGHLNLFYRVGALEVGASTHINFLNLFRGGSRISIGPYATILRKNTLNAIIDPDFVEPVVPVLHLGAGVVISSGHWLDFSAGLSLGAHTIVAGRNSSLWTHCRQRGGPIRIGCHCFLGSEVRVAPGTVVPPFCVVSLGSVLTGHFERPRSLIVGNPACAIRSLNERDWYLVTRKNRDDIPDPLAWADLPDDLLTARIR